jgi:type IV pilus assembly protein PilC
MFLYFFGTVFLVTSAISVIPISVYLWARYHVSKVHVAMFFRQMSIMLDAGIPLLRVLKILSERVSHPKLRRMIQEILVSVENGNTVASAMAGHPQVFDEMMVGIIKVGETGGVLDESARRLSVYLEKAIRLRRKVVAASVYPLMTVTVLLAVLVILIVFVFPNILEPLKANPHVVLPPLTLAVDAIGQFGLRNWHTILFAGILAIFGLALFRRTRPGKMIEDYLKLKSPLLGNYLGARIASARVASMFATLVHCGISIIPTLKIIAQTQPNYYVSESFKHTAKVVEEGGSIVKPLEESGIYPQLMIDMIAVGDESGTLDSALDKTAQAFTEEVDAAIEIFTQIQEALLILTVGGLVMIVALAAYLPYFQLWQISNG